VEVRGFEPRTPCMPWANGSFISARLRTIRQQAFGLWFSIVRDRSTVFIAVAEVVAEVGDGFIYGGSRASIQ
jgi:hypothetical protein